MSQEFSATALIAGHNEEDIVGHAVRHLIDQGIDVYFIDHESADGTLAEVEPLLGMGVVAIERFPAESPFSPNKVAECPWESILRRKEQLAGELDADWLIHSDADEFAESPWDGLFLIEALRRVDSLGYNAIDFEILEFPPVGGEWPSRAGLEATFPGWRRPRNWRRPQVRCWKKQGVEVELVASGGAEVEFPGRLVLPVAFPMRHYPIRSQEHGERKVAERREMLAREADRGWHTHFEESAEGREFVEVEDALTAYNRRAVALHLMVSPPSHRRSGGDDPSGEREVAVEPSGGEEAVDEALDDARRARNRLESALLDRDRKVEALGRRVMQFETAASEAEKSTERLEREVEQGADQLETLRQELADLEFRLSGSQREQRETSGMHDEATRTLELRRRELGEVEGAFRGLEQVVADLKGELAEEKELSAAARERIAALEGSLSWRATRLLRSLGIDKLES